MKPGTAIPRPSGEARPDRGDPVAVELDVAGQELAADERGLDAEPHGSSARLIVAVRRGEPRPRRLGVDPGEERDDRDLRVAVRGAQRLVDPLGRRAGRESARSAARGPRASRSPDRRRPSGSRRSCRSGSSRSSRSCSARASGSSPPSAASSRRGSRRRRERRSRAGRSARARSRGRRRGRRSAPRPRRPRSSAPTTYGVRPLALIATTASAAPNAERLAAPARPRPRRPRRPPARAASRRVPPAISAVTCPGRAEKVASHSAASSSASRPEVPAPT